MADYTRFQLRGDTRANWLSVNPILAKNEPAIETDTKRFKIGDGVSTYSQLSYGRNTSEYASVYNVTSLYPLPSGFYEHSTAILAVPSGERSLGLIITYETASGVWYTERFIGTDVANWVTLSNWEKLPDAGDLAQLRSDLSGLVDNLDYIYSNERIGGRTFNNGATFSGLLIAQTIGGYIYNGILRVFIECDEYRGNLYIEVYNRSNEKVYTTDTIAIDSSKVKIDIPYSYAKAFYYIIAIPTSGEAYDGIKIFTITKFINQSKVDILENDVEQAKVDIVDLKDDVQELQEIVKGSDELIGTRTFSETTFSGLAISQTNGDYIYNGNIIVEVISDSYRGDFYIEVYNSSNQKVYTTNNITLGDTGKVTTEIAYNYESAFYYIVGIPVSGSAENGSIWNIYKKKTNTRLDDIEEEISNLDADTIEDWSHLIGVDNSNPLSKIKKEAGFGAMIHSWGFIGDSLSSGCINRSYNGVGFWGTYYEYSWGQQLMRILGSEGFNFSASSQTTYGWIMSNVGQPERAWQGAQNNPKDAYIIALGQNDLGRTLGDISNIHLDDYNNNPNTIVGDYAGIIQRLRSINPDCYIFCVTNPRTEQYTAMNNAIKEIVALFNKCYVIDVANYAPSYYNETFVNNYMYSLHMSPAGYMWTAYLMNTYIDWIIRNNYTDFLGLPWVHKETQVKITFIKDGAVISESINVMLTSEDKEMYQNFATVNGVMTMPIVPGKYDLYTNKYTPSINTLVVGNNNIDMEVTLSQ